MQVDNTFQDDASKRISRLESDVQALCHQGDKFETWFQDAGNKISDMNERLARTQSEVLSIRT